MPCLKLLEYLDIILMMYGNIKNTDLFTLIVVRYSSGKVTWYAIDFSRQVCNLFVTCQVFSKDLSGVK